MHENLPGPQKRSGTEQLVGGIFSRGLMTYHIPMPFLSMWLFTDAKKYIRILSKADTHALGFCGLLDSLATHRWLVPLHSLRKGTLPTKKTLKRNVSRLRLNGTQTTVFVVVAHL